MQHGGRARMEVVNRIMRARFTLWRAKARPDHGACAPGVLLLYRMTDSNTPSPTIPPHLTKLSGPHHSDEEAPKKIGAGQGCQLDLLSRAALQLCSCGIAPWRANLSEGGSRWNTSIRRFNQHRLALAAKDQESRLPFCASNLGWA